MNYKLRREECDNALVDLFETHDRYINQSRKPLLIMEKLIKEHFENQPLKLEELEEGLPYWDSKRNEWCFIKSILGKNFICFYPDGRSICTGFNENRFYRKKVE